MNPYDTSKRIERLKDEKVLFLRQNGKKYHEIAKEMDCSIERARQRYRRAIRRSNCPHWSDVFHTRLANVLKSSGLSKEEVKFLWEKRKLKQINGLGKTGALTVSVYFESEVWQEAFMKPKGFIPLRNEK